MLYPWEKQSRSNLNRCELNGEENPCLKQLRDNDLLNPAPFSHRTMVILCNDGARDYIKPFDFDPYLTIGQWVETRQDVPVGKILGISNPGHLHGFEPGMTYREVLFECLHGYGIIPETLTFLASGENKDHEIPQEDDPNRQKASRGGMELIQYGDWYVIKNGQQRGIMAMFHIWQTYGGNGLLLNVRVENRIPKDILNKPASVKKPPGWPGGDNKRVLLAAYFSVSFARFTGLGTDASPDPAPVSAVLTFLPDSKL